MISALLEAETGAGVVEVCWGVAAGVDAAGAAEGEDAGVDESAGLDEDADGAEAQAKNIKMPKLNSKQ